MTTATTFDPCTTQAMGKQKKTNAEKRKTPRVNIGVPGDWHAVLRRLAARHRQPVLFTLIEIIKEKAEAEGIAELPPVPWGTDEETEG